MEMLSVLSRLARVGAVGTMLLAGGALLASGSGCSESSSDGGASSAGGSDSTPGGSSEGTDRGSDEPALAGAGGTGSASSSTRTGGEVVLALPVRTDGPKSLDPVEGSTTYDNMATVQLYETLLVNKYSDPMQYEPLLVTQIPASDDGGLTWKFELKKGVRFHDNACFPNGEGRELVTDDVFYSLKRMADDQYKLENWWLIADTIEGFDAFKDEQNAAEEFDYDAPVPGFRKIDDHNFEIRLAKPVTRFLWIMTMFQTSIVPREAVEFYGEDFPFNPVGTGPFMLESSDDWVPKQSLTLVRNPNYHEVLYPAREEWDADARRMRLHRAAGQRVPFVDRVEMTMYPQDQPMFLQFRAGRLGYSELPDPFYEEIFDEQTREVLPEVKETGITVHSVQLLDFIFRGFNMEDELVGAPAGESGKKLRQAISLALDLDEVNERFYSGTNVVYDGPIPPGLDGHPEPGENVNPYRGPNLELARQKLAEAGYPEGDGLPTIRYYTTRNSINLEMGELTKRQLARLGIDLDVIPVDFSTLIETVNKKNAPMFTFAWSSDYPDAENNLALFYGPNESPGSNHYNYKNPEYDALYEQVLTMLPGSERTEVYERMRDMLLEDVPYIGSMARTRNYVINDWLLNARPTERYYAWFKFLDVDQSKLPQD
jgi:oligopeptide transport system substrate-binding protein